MKNHFIPVNNNIDKAIAFAQSLDQNFIKNNKIKQSPVYIKTVDILENLQGQGWLINGVCESKNKNRKVANHFVRLEHPDFTIKSKNKTEGVSNLYITNSCSGTKPLNLDFGVYRLVCSNGLVRRDSYTEFNFKHNETSLKRIPITLQNINKDIQKSLQEFEKLKQKELTEAQIDELALNASLLRFERNTIDYQQLLKAYRNEDEGNSLWNVYNRIQENLTKSDLLIDRKGNSVKGINNAKEDIKLNQNLFDLVELYA